MHRGGVRQLRQRHVPHRDRLRRTLRWRHAAERALQPRTHHRARANRGLGGGQHPQQQQGGGEEQELRSTALLHFVDLAGSERLARTGSSGIRWEAVCRLGRNFVGKRFSACFAVEELVGRCFSVLVGKLGRGSAYEQMPVYAVGCFSVLVILYAAFCWCFWGWGGNCGCVCRQVYAYGICPSKTTENCWNFTRYCTTCN
jgi:hypothetical protein